MTDYHKPGDLKQQKLILLHIWRLEVKNQDVSGAPSLSESSRGEFFCSFFGVLVAQVFLGLELPNFFFFFAVIDSLLFFFFFLIYFY